MTKLTESSISSLKAPLVLNIGFVGAKESGSTSDKPDNTKSNQNLSDLHNNIIEQYNNNFTTDDALRLLDLYFYKEFYKYQHLHDSYDKFIDETIPRFFTEVQHVFSEIIPEDRYIKHKFTFENVRADSPKLSK